jgi:hypothetical protein
MCTQQQDHWKIGPKACILAYAIISRMVINNVALAEY